jgi:hypothetical protein
MENRERDKVSRINGGPTEGGEVNRKTEEDRAGSTFGQKIHRSEDPLDEQGRQDRSGSSEGNH